MRGFEKNEPRRKGPEDKGRGFETNLEKEVSTK